MRLTIDLDDATRDTVLVFALRYCLSTEAAAVALITASARMLNADPTVYDDIDAQVAAAWRAHVRQRPTAGT